MQHKKTRPDAVKKIRMRPAIKIVNPAMSNLLPIYPDPKPGRATG